MHGEELVVGRLVEELQIGEGELRPHHQRERTGEEEETEAGEEIEKTDALVVGGGQVVDDAAALAGQRRPPRSLLQLGGGHGAALWDASHVANSEGLTARMLKRIWSWRRPQNSAHWPV